MNNIYSIASQTFDFGKEVTSTRSGGGGGGGRGGGGGGRGRQQR